MFYKLEIQTPKEGPVASSVATYEDAKSAEIAYHSAVAYNLQLDTLSSFLIMIITDTGYINNDLRKFYNFEIPQPEPEPELEEG
jgi:hypothetical protein